MNVILHFEENHSYTIEEGQLLQRNSAMLCIVWTSS